MTNPAYSKTLGAIATDPQAFYTGEIARDIVAAAADTSGGRTPSQMTLEDLAGYAVKKREPLCTPYRGREICGMPPPSSGGIAVAATLGMLEHFAMADHKPTDVDLNGGRPAVMGVHLISEAERLAYADRDKLCRRYRFRSAARRLARHAAQQRLPGRAGGADLRDAHYGHRRNPASSAHRPPRPHPPPSTAPARSAS